MSARGRGLRERARAARGGVSGGGVSGERVGGGGPNLLGVSGRRVASAMGRAAPTCRLLRPPAGSGASSPCLSPFPSVPALWARLSPLLRGINRTLGGLAGKLSRRLGCLERDANGVASARGACLQIAARASAPRSGLPGSPRPARQDRTSRSKNPESRYKRGRGCWPKAGGWLPRGERSQAEDVGLSSATCIRASPGEVGPSPRAVKLRIGSPSCWVARGCSVSVEATLCEADAAGETGRESLWEAPCEFHARSLHSLCF